MNLRHPRKHLGVVGARCVSKRCYNAAPSRFAMIRFTRLIIALALLACLLSGSPAIAQKPGEVTLPEGTRIALHLNDHLSTKQNSEGNAFSATLTAPLSQGDREVLRKGSVVTASVSRVVRPGRSAERR
jgi:hypothetical protein